MKALVTGANGFVGSAVVQALLKRGNEVRALVRARSDHRNLARLPIDIQFGDLLDRPSIDRAMAGCDAVFHVAADYRLWVPEPRRMFAVNVDGTRNIMESALAAGVGRVVYTSSVATLGILKDGAPADEETPSTYEDMVGPYKRSKFLAEMLVSDMVRSRGLPAVIVNPSTPMGPRDIRPTPTGKIIVEAAEGRMPAFVDTGLNVVHVDDVADGHLLAFDKGRIGQRYILGSENLTLAEILRRIAFMTGRRAPTVRIPHDVVLPLAAGAEFLARFTGREPFATRDGINLARKRMFFSSAKAEAELGYRPRPAGAALADALAWFRANGYLR